MKRLGFLLLLGFLCREQLLKAQFAPQVGQPGSDAIAWNDVRIQGWATLVEVHRGWVQYDKPALGRVTNGEAQAAIGAADGLTVVSLGDSGFATCQFKQPLADGPGPDFAVFENGFLPGFLELAFVEVSSNGIDYVRFKAQSLTETAQQIGPFDILDASKLHNLAGKYIAGYGVPFDLNELKNQQGIDIHHITHIRIVDVIGSISPDIGLTDAMQRLINDPFPTPFATGGFDLDAVAVLHTADDGLWAVFPTLLQQGSNAIQLIGYQNFWKAELLNEKGQSLTSWSPSPRQVLPPLPSGIYLLQLYGENRKTVVKLLVR